MVDRLKQYISGGESLFSAAYYSITAIEGSTAGMAGWARKNAATKFRIELEVLKMLGELSSERGSPLEARKAGRQPPTGSERQWLESALRRVIRQVASVEGGDTLSRLSMSDLPTISSHPPA
jgi:CRISPR/Cas system endoribonuclease Cas6 (RAMP superfamily)